MSCPVQSMFSRVKSAAAAASNARAAAAAASAGAQAGAAAGAAPAYVSLRAKTPTLLPHSSAPVSTQSQVLSELMAVDLDGITGYEALGVMKRWQQLLSRST